MTVKVDKYHVLIKSKEQPLLKKDSRDGSLAFFEEKALAEACQALNKPCEVAELHYVNHSDYLALEENLDMVIGELEGAANFLRGMMFDPALPSHIKEAVTFKLSNLESTLAIATGESQDF